MVDGSSCFLVFNLACTVAAAVTDETMVICALYSLFLLLHSCRRTVPVIDSISDSIELKLSSSVAVVVPLSLLL